MADERLTAQPPPAARPWVTRAEVAATLALLAAFLVWLTVIVIGQYRAGKGIEVIRAHGGPGKYLIDLNKAEAGELMLLPGIGKARAEKILAWRREHGAFTTFDDLRRAAGLSAADVERVRAMAALGEAEAQPPAPDQFATPESQ